MNLPKEYVAHRVQTASPLELIRILYETALQAVHEALAALQSGDIMERGRAVTKAVEAMTELRLSLRYDLHQDYCKKLSGLYGYMQGQLVRAHAEQSEGPLREVSRLMETLLSGWTEAMQQLDNSQARESFLGADDQAVLQSDANPYSAERAGGQVRSWQL